MGVDHLRHEAGAEGDRDHPVCHTELEPRTSRPDEQAGLSGRKVGRDGLTGRGCVILLLTRAGLALDRPEYAYGDKKQDKVPAGSTLVFYMELLRLGKVKGEKTTYGTIQGKPGGVRIEAGSVTNRATDADTD